MSVDQKRRTSASRKPVPGSLSHAGRAVAGGKAEQRERRLREQRRATQLKVLAAIAAVALVVLGGALLYRSQLFAVASVDVRGASRLSADQVRAIAAIPGDATLLRLPVDSMETRLLHNPWISSARVSRDFPDTVRIRITERRPAAVVDLGGKKLWLVDADGVWLSTLSGDTTRTPVIIRDVEGLDPVAGRKTSSETLHNALEIVARLDAVLRKSVRTISAPSIDKTALITAKDVEIFVGSSDDIARKQQVAEEILRQQAGKVVYINVRTVDRPTWRGLDADK